MAIPTDRIINKLDDYLSKKDFDGAKRHLNYWLDEARAIRDGGGEILILNEFMGLSRKLDEKNNALEYVRLALDKIAQLNIENNVGSATTYLNSATVYKAFNDAEKSILLFEKARKIYEENLKSTDARLGGLYNNMALTLVDLGRFDEAITLYNKAIGVMENVEGAEPEIAITYLNMASLIEAKIGIINSAEIDNYLEKAKELLERVSFRQDGNYAFVLEKCAPVFSHYNHTEYAEKLTARYRGIYERA